MKTPILNSISKEAGWVRPAWGATKGIAGKGLLTMFGATMGAEALRQAGDIASKGQVGAASKARWDADVARRHAATTDPKLLRSSQRAVGKGGLLGTLGGALATLPFAMKKGKPKNYILPIAGALLGRSLGRGLTKKKHPAAVPKSSLIDTTMNRYSGLFSPEDRKEIMAIRNDPKVKHNPQIQQQISQMLETKVKNHPDYNRWHKKRNVLSTLGKVLGGGAMLAAMIYGKGKLHKGKLAKGILGTRGGFMSGNTRKIFAGLGLGGGALGIGSAYTGAKRAKLTPAETRSAVGKRALSADTAMELGFYGNAFRKGFL